MTGLRFSLYSSASRFTDIGQNRLYRTKVSPRDKSKGIQVVLNGDGEAEGLTIERRSLLRGVTDNRRKEITRCEQNQNRDYWSGNCAGSLLQGLHYYRFQNPQEAIGLMHWEIGGTSPGTLRSFRPLIWTNARLARMWTKRSLPGPTAQRFSAVISPSPTCIYRRASQSFSRMSAYFRVVFNKLFAFSPHPTPIIHLTPRPFVIHYKGARSWYG